MAPEAQPENRVGRGGGGGGARGDADFRRPLRGAGPRCFTAQVQPRSVKISHWQNWQHDDLQNLQNVSKIINVFFVNVKFLNYNILQIFGGRFFVYEKTSRKERLRWLCNFYFHCKGTDLCNERRYSSFSIERASSPPKPRFPEPAENPIESKWHNPVKRVNTMVCTASFTFRICKLYFLRLPAASISSFH